ncbi:MAG: PQQ-dependent sugar dehydrogenase, partial [Rhodothermales bacterium]
MRCTLLLVILAATWTTGTARAQTSFALEPAFPGLSFERPVDLQHAGDGSNRLFVVEQRGVIRVFANDPSANDAPFFLDIRSRVRDTSSEEGLLGLAFHPNYADNGFFYVYYSASNRRRSVIARYSVNPNNPDRADTNSEVVLLEVTQPFDNHNGGQIRFGPDGFLYIALGDGGSGGDPQGHGQNRTTLLGSIVRIDVDTPSGGRNYGIPSDNPFVGNTEGFREEIYAYGLRNPWRFSFDADTGRLWAADVGQDDFEEVDIIESGGNYGWNTMEGFHCFRPSSGCNQNGLALPVWEYAHQGGRRSVTGGFVYRGTNVPELAGHYVYADFITGQIWALEYDGQQVVQNTELRDTNLPISAFGVDERHELYLCSFDGLIYRFVPTVGTAVGEADVPETPARLHANHPNPFRDATTITYSLDRAAAVELAVYDVLGRCVRTLVSGRQVAGTHTTRWDGRSESGARVAGGVYFSRLSVDGL